MSDILYAITQISQVACTIIDICTLPIKTYEGIKDIVESISPPNIPQMQRYKTVMDKNQEEGIHFGPDYAFMMYDDIEKAEYAIQKLNKLVHNRIHFLAIPAQLIANPNRLLTSQQKLPITDPTRMLTTSNLSQPTIEFSVKDFHNLLKTRKGNICKLLHKNKFISKNSNKS